MIKTYDIVNCVYTKLNEKEIKIFRKFLKSLLSRSASWAEPWFQEARNLNYKIKIYGTIYKSEYINFVSQIPFKLITNKLTREKLILSAVLIKPIQKPIFYKNLLQSLITVNEQF